jgi:hypothetical protein
MARERTLVVRGAVFPSRRSTFPSRSSPFP